MGRSDLDVSWVNEEAEASSRIGLREVLSEKLSDMTSNHVAVFLQGKMAGVQQMNLHGIEVLLISTGPVRAEERIAHAPHHERRGLMLAEVGLPLRIAVQVGPVVGLQLQLNELVALPVEPKLIVIHASGVIASGSRAPSVY